MIRLPYAIAPVFTGLWAFLFTDRRPDRRSPAGLGIPWDPNTAPGDAQSGVMIAAVWKQHLLRLHFLVAALLSVDALASRGARRSIDARTIKRFSPWRSAGPADDLFLIVMNLV